MTTLLLLLHHHHVRLALTLMALTALIPPTSAVNLYVASYAGTITTLSLLLQPPALTTSPTTLSPTSSYTYNLTQTSTLNTSTHTPSWLTLDRQNAVLYMVDEAVNATNGTVVSYRTSWTGALSEIARVEDIGGGVYAEFFGDGGGLAVPHYTGSALQTYTITSPGHLTPSQTFTYTLSQPGTVPSRQDAPHPHEAVLDPTRQYVLVPDLGADLVRVYLVNSTTNNLTATAPLKAKAGSGPRHAAFTRDPVAEGHYVFYLVAEIASTVTAYRVKYPEAVGGGLTFEEVGVYSTLAPGQAVPATTTGESTGVGAEVAVSPDGSTLLISNRRDLTFNNTTPPSDSMSSFAISPSDGSLTFLQLFPAGGSYPRQFAFNRAGNLVAVGLQQTGTVAILERDVGSGVFEREVARIAIAGGEVVCTVWDD